MRRIVCHLLKQCHFTNPQSIPFPLEVKVKCFRPPLLVAAADVGGGGGGDGGGSGGGISAKKANNGSMAGFGLLPVKYTHNQLPPSLLPSLPLPLSLHNQRERGLAWSAKLIPYNV